MYNEIPFSGVDPEAYGSLRTEDIRFSPSGKRIAVVATDGRLVLFAIKHIGQSLEITHQVSLESNSFYSPHGVEFLTENIVAVANRGSRVSFYKVPPLRNWRQQTKVEQIHELNAPWFGEISKIRELKGRKVLCGNGSVRIKDGLLFTGCNNQSTLSVHPVKTVFGRVQTGEGQLINTENLSIPDGVALSRDGKWIAVGEHENRCILIIDRATMSQHCMLNDPNLSHPHGVCFDTTGNTLFSADAGLQDLHVFTTTDGWKTPMSNSSYSFKAIDDDLFAKSKADVAEQFRSLDGGIKGVDVDPTGRILATTCKFQILRFFDLQRTGN